MRLAAKYARLGILPADQHEFTLPVRRQSRRPDVRLHRGMVTPETWIQLRGLPVTRPSRMASDLLADGEDPEAVGHIIVDALRGSFDYPGTVADALAPHAARFGLRRGDGLALLRWLLELVGDPDTGQWLEQARAQMEHSMDAQTQERARTTAGGHP